MPLAQLTNVDNMDVMQQKHQGQTNQVTVAPATSYWSRIANPDLAKDGITVAFATAVRPPTTM